MEYDKTRTEYIHCWSKMTKRQPPEIHMNNFKVNHLNLCLVAIGWNKHMVSDTQQKLLWCQAPNESYHTSFIWDRLRESTSKVYSLKHFFMSGCPYNVDTFFWYHESVKFVCIHFLHNFVTQSEIDSIVVYESYYLQRLLIFRPHPSTELGFWSIIIFSSKWKPTE